jgi:hypothetical protein
MLGRGGSFLGLGGFISSPPPLVGWGMQCALVPAPAVWGGEPLSELHGRSRLIQFGEIFEIKILNDKWFCKINYPLDKPRSLTVQESPCVNNFVEVLKKFLNIAGQRILHLSIEQVKAIVKWADHDGDNQVTYYKYLGAIADLEFQ